MEDWRLLREFVATGSEEAFTEVVNRHLGLVYSTALRRLHDAHAAEEVTQSVFTLLAQKARKLRSGVILAAWLYRTTCFKAAQHHRAEFRRRAREQEAAAMQHLDSPSETDAAWHQIEPLLDDALQQLGETDRAALLLRYFQQKRLRDVGLALGVEEEAARKRVDRALDKLRSLLASRGITATASALSLVLNARVAEPIPAVLANRLARSALIAAGAATTSTLGLLTFMASVNLKTVVAALASLLFASAVAVKLYLPSKSGRDPANLPAVEASQANAVRRVANPFAIRPSADSSASSTDTLLAAALARVAEALNAPSPVYSVSAVGYMIRNGVREGPIHVWSIPDGAMQEAIAALGDQRKAAVPLLRDAIKGARTEAWQRAADGLGLIGSEAKEAVPDLIDRLHASAAGDLPGKIAIALSRMVPLTEIFPDLVQVMTRNPHSRRVVGEFFWQLPDTDSTLVDAAVRPLLEDANSDVREAAAYALARALKHKAGVKVIQVAIASLKTGVDEGMGLVMLQDAGQDPNDPRHVRAANFGPLIDDAIAALIDVSNRNPQEHQRVQALQLLDDLNPNLRRENPNMDALLREQSFIERIQFGQASVPELIEGLKEFPKAARVTAVAISRLGSDAQAALPALREALQGTDSNTYDAVVAEVKKMNPNFFGTQPTP